jgi:hypothetical protein
VDLAAIDRGAAEPPRISIEKLAGGVDPRLYG